ncbi:MAG: ATP-binding protein [Herbaspirillum sp.]
MTLSDGLDLDLRNDPTELARLARAVEHFCAQYALPIRLAFNLNLVLEEVVVNIMHYAFTEPGNDTIHVHLNVSDGLVQTRVRDAGRAFDPTLVPVPDLSRNLEQRVVGGLGVHFLRTLMDEVRYTRQNGENCLYFSKALAPPVGS